MYSTVQATQQTHYVMSTALEGVHSYLCAICALRITCYKHEIGRRERKGMDAKHYDSTRDVNVDRPTVYRRAQQHGTRVWITQDTSNTRSPPGHRNMLYHTATWIRVIKKHYSKTDTSKPPPTERTIDADTDADQLHKRGT